MLANVESVPLTPLRGESLPEPPAPTDTVYKTPDVKGKLVAVLNPPAPPPPAPTPPVPPPPPPPPATTRYSASVKGTIFRLPTPAVIVVTLLSPTIVEDPVKPAPRDAMYVDGYFRITTPEPPDAPA
jgi:hypothetical protein